MLSEHLRNYRPKIPYFLEEGLATTAGGEGCAWERQESRIFCFPENFGKRLTAIEPFVTFLLSSNPILTGIDRSYEPLLSNGALIASALYSSD
jgi:hypothetical protein